MSADPNYNNSRLAAACARRLQPNPATPLHVERQELNFCTLANETSAHLTAADFHQSFMATVLQRLDDSVLGMAQLSSGYAGNKLIAPKLCPTNLHTSSTGISRLSALNNSLVAVTNTKTQHVTALLPLIPKHGHPQSSDTVSTDAEPTW